MDVRAETVGKKKFLQALLSTLKEHRRPRVGVPTWGDKFWTPDGVALSLSFQLLNEDAPRSVEILLSDLSAVAADWELDVDELMAKIVSGGSRQVVDARTSRSILRGTTE